MLAAGRELNITNRETVCRCCKWEGTGNQLSAGLVRSNHSGIYLVAYRCPECGSFDLACRGKLLVFPVSGTDDRDHDGTLIPKRRRGE